MFPTHLPSSTVRELYRAADTLDRRWHRAGLSDDFGSRMIDAVLRHLARTESTSRLAETDYSRYAVTLLYSFWIRNARRDAARYARAILDGARPSVVSLDSIESIPTHPISGDLYAPLQYDLCAGETGRVTVQVLVALGYSREWSWAFVWRESGRKWDEVAILLAERFGFEATAVQLRQWGVRKFARMRAEVRQALSVDPPEARESPPTGKTAHCQQIFLPEPTKRLLQNIASTALIK